MTPRGTSVRSEGAQILVFGEDENDRRAIIELIRGLRPDLRVKFQPAKKPLTLVRGMGVGAAGARNRKIVAAIKAADARQRVHATVLHEDADDVEPAHLALIAEKEAALAQAPWYREPGGEDRRDPSSQGHQRQLVPVRGEGDGGSRALPGAPSLTWGVSPAQVS